jgi:hypothetical protein
MAVYLVLVALICIIPCFVALLAGFVKVNTIQGEIARCDIRVSKALESIAGIANRVQDVKLPDFEKILNEIRAVEHIAKKATLRCEELEESIANTNAKLSSRERVQKKNEREKSRVQEEEIVDVADVPQLQANLFGGFDATRPAAPETTPNGKRRFGQVPNHINGAGR